MRKKIIVLFFILSLTITGCTHTRAVWRQEGISKYDTKTAISECKYKIGLQNISREKENKLFKYCMESKGFRLKRERYSY